MATEITRNITEDLTLTDKYELTANDDILNITVSTVTLDRLADDRFPSEENDMDTVTNAAIPAKAPLRFDGDTRARTFGEAAAETPSLVVTTGDDVVDAYDGVTSLREAVAYAQSLGGEQAISFAEDYVLTVKNEIRIDSAITISAAENQNIVFDGGETLRCYFPNASLFHAYYDSNVSLNKLTVQNYLVDTLQNPLLESVVGAVVNWGTLTVRNCQFVDNHFNSNDLAAALAVGGWGVTVTIVENSVFTGNSTKRNGGAFWNDGRICTIDGCIFSGNFASGDGGAIYSTHGGHGNDTLLTIKDSIFETPTDSIWTHGNTVLQGMISLAANFYSTQTVNANGATINYLLSSYNSANNTVIVSDQTKISGASYRVTVAENQTFGTYKLAGNAANFVSAMSLTVGEDTYTDALNVGGSYSVGGRDYSLALDGDNVLTLTVSNAPAPAEGSTAGDLNADGRADIVMTIAQSGHDADGSTGAWLIQADQTPAWGDLSTRNEGWEIFGTGRTAAGKASADVYVRSTGNVIGAWTTGPDGNVTGWETVGEFDAQTRIVGLGDFNGNGQTDLLLRNANGAVGCFFTGGETTGWNYFQSLGDEWKLSAIGDLNGDGRDDVVLKHDAGFAGSWLTQADGTMAWADLDTLPEGFAIVGSGDFNGDGTDDVLLQKDSYFGAWLVQNGNAAGWMGLGDLPNVTVEQIADFDGDGKDDLRVRTTAGDLGSQLVKGADTLEWKYYGSVGDEWSTALAAL